LAHDVAANAAGAAFADPRLPAVTRDDFAEMSVKVSVLGPLERLAVGSIDELRSVLHVGTDGLLIIDGRRRATFLPSVWDQAPTVDNFLALLWDKAGLRRAQWPRRLDLYRYETQEFGD
jgi:AmmeMemoRadiSam system protein A